MAASLKVGEVLNGRYPIMGILGEGGMGAVYKASDLNSTRLWAIKEMTENFATDAERQEAIAGFEQEARILSQLDHPNLPRITHFFTDRGHQYLVMDLVEGQTWERIQNSQKQSIADVLAIAWQLTDVLGYLHNRPQPIIFRDLKPANVMITSAGVAKLIDFGIARVFQADKATDTRALGTPGYAAPEQYGTGQSDARTDIYALGVMMHQAFTGIDPSKEPFKFESISSLEPGFPEALEAIVNRAISLNRDDRFADIVQMRAAMSNLHNDPDVYDQLPPALRTGILPRPQAKTGTVGETASAATATSKSNTPASVAKTTTAKRSTDGSDSLSDVDKRQKPSCLPWLCMGLLFCASLIPYAGLVAAVLAWLVVFYAKGQRISMIILAIAIALCSIMSAFFGTMLYNMIFENAGNVTG